MLNRLAFANSLAVLTAALYVLFAILALIAPRVFQVLFDAQFFGANVASLFPKVQTSAASLVTLVLMIGMSWVVGYAWAAAVRRIFALYASGTGLRTIAKTLTAEGAPPPTPRQRDRLPGWGPAALRGILRRELYHGEVVWNRRKKIDRGGRTKVRVIRPETTWCA